MTSMSIRLKMTLWYSSLIAVALIILGAGVYLFVTYNTYNDVRVNIMNSIDKVGVIVNKDESSGIEFRIGGVSIDTNSYVQIVDYTRGVIIQSDALIGSDIQFDYPSTPDKVEQGFVQVVENSYNFMIYNKPVKIGDNTVALIQGAAYIGREDKYLDDLRSILIFSILFVLLVTFTSGLYLAGRALDPLKKIIQTANSVQDRSNLSVRIERGLPNDELGRLTDTLNGMLERIETTYNELNETYHTQRRFVSDASHELRTPLTTIRGNIELMQKMSSGQLEPSNLHTMQEMMEDIADESRRMSDLVADLLSLARSDAGVRTAKTKQRVLPIIEDVARRASVLPRKAEWEVADLSEIEDVTIFANSDAVQQLLFIFIDNAFKYTPSGAVSLRAMVSPDRAQLGIVISDTGIGLSNEQIPKIFDRFYRADASRGETSGTGLGLSIAKAIIDEHRGSIEVKSIEGQGSEFTLWFPLALIGSEDGV